MPLEFADLVGNPTDGANIVLLVADQLTNLVFIADLFLNCFTGYLDKMKRAVILDRRQIILSYLRTWFAPDLIGAIPFDLVAICCGEACVVDPYRRWVLKWLRVLRLCRVLRIIPIIARLQVRSGLKQTTRMGLFFSLGGLFMAHISACCWYAIGINAGTWVEVEDPQHLWSLTDAYVAALYWSFTTMSTIGYGVSEVELDPSLCSYPLSCCSRRLTRAPVRTSPRATPPSAFSAA